MLVAVAIVLLVLASVLFHRLSPWWHTPLASNWTSIDAALDVTLWICATAFIALNLFMAMMWIFLLSDTFIFSSFLVAYMTMRITVTAPWPNPSEVFALDIGGQPVPLILIAIMTFVLISSSGTMAMAVNQGYRRNRRATAALMLATALLGASFVGMQALEWSKLISEGVRPWANPMGAAQFGASFFMITGFHGMHVSVGVIILLVVATRVARGQYDRSGSYDAVEIAGLYWHFVDLVWVFIFAFFYLW